METTPSFEIKSIDDAGSIEGLAAAFGNVDHGGDQLMPGAFAKTIAAIGGRPLPMLLHHKIDRPVGAWTHLEESPEGLVAKGRIAVDSSDGKDAHALVRAGALGGLSIGFTTERKSYTGSVRNVHQAALHEISLTPIGLNDRALVRSVKSLAEVGDLREILREYGFSAREAKAMAGAAWQARTAPEDDDSADLAAIKHILTQSAARMAAIRKGI